jgi:signal transduction histidine kinase
MILRLSVGVSLVALLVLAGLQYHWVGQMAVAERQRLERSIAESSEEFAEDLFNELRSLAMMLEPRPQNPSDVTSIAARYKEWAETAAYPTLLKNLYLAQVPSRVLRLDPAKGVFEPSAWPPELAPMADFVARRIPVPLNLGTDALLIPLDRRPLPPRQGRGFRGPGGPPPPGPRGGRGGPRRGFPEGRGFPPPGAPPPPELEEERWLVAELNRNVLVTQILPSLAELRFSDYDGQNHRVAVISRRQGDVRRTVFTTGGAWSDEDLATPDYQLELLVPPLPRQPVGGRPPGPPPGERGAGGGRGERGPRGSGPGGRPVVGLIGQEWRLLAKHRAGSVEVAATQFRMRNLAVSFGVLVVLGMGAAAIVVSGTRAKRLGKLQMEFAAGVSHELRTPLAVIQSAAHNLGAGVVQDREGIAEYAAIVQTEARRLSEMVEQVMTYTETQSGRKRYDLGPVDLGDVIDIALRNMSMVLREGSATVQRRIDPGVPPVMADAPALTRCLQNLLSNAVKYGRSNYSAQIDIEARVVPGSPDKVELSVIDQGLGVPEADIHHLFEAFHRGSNAMTNTPGNGLGLHLVQRLMEAQHGSVTYVRTLAGGAKFTLTLPAAKPT